LQKGYHEEINRLLTDSRNLEKKRKGKAGGGIENPGTRAEQVNSWYQTRSKRKKEGLIKSKG
jgi:hypothetical protein